MRPPPSASKMVAVASATARSDDWSSPSRRSVWRRSWTDRAARPGSIPEVMVSIPLPLRARYGWPAGAGQTSVVVRLVGELTPSGRPLLGCRRAPGREAPAGAELRARHVGARAAVRLPRGRDD